MKIELDLTVDALYLRLQAGKVARTVELEEDVYLDVDKQGRVLGVEFVSAKDFLPFLRRHGGRLEIPEAIKDFAALAPVSL